MLSRFLLVYVLLTIVTPTAHGRTYCGIGKSLLDGANQVAEIDLYPPPDYTSADIVFPGPKWSGIVINDMWAAVRDENRNFVGLVSHEHEEGGPGYFYFGKNLGMNGYLLFLRAQKYSESLEILSAGSLRPRRTQPLPDWRVRWIGNDWAAVLDAEKTLLGMAKIGKGVFCGVFID